MRISLPILTSLGIIDGFQEFPAWILGIPSILGAVAIVLIQVKKGEPATKTIGKVLLGFGCGYFLGGVVALKYGLDRLASSFIAAVGSPALLAAIENRIKGTLK